MVQIAFLRGINVGKAKRVAMAELRAMFEELGYNDVKTLLNSVVFSGPVVKSEAKIEEAFTARFGFSSRFTIISGADLEAAVNENPLGDFGDHSRFFVAFLRTAAHRSRLETVAGQDWGAEGFGQGTRWAYLWCPEGILSSPLNAAVTKALGDGVTARNWATVLKLRALVAA
jgi:uncharacterized protein (DUF1697 family)